MEARIIDIPKIEDRRGNLSFVENGSWMPFHIERAYWIYDVPGGESRGSHAHRILSQLIIAVNGSFTVQLYQGLYVPPGTWRTLDDFSSGSVCLVLASECYNPEDYIYDYDEFLAYKHQIGQ